MIPTNDEELHALAGEYVLGVLDPEDARAIAEARLANEALDRAILFWQERLHPLSRLAAPADPPPGTWEEIASRIEQPAAQARGGGLWHSAVLWRWSTVGFAGIAAALALYIAATPPPVALAEALAVREVSWTPAWFALS